MTIDPSNLRALALSILDWADGQRLSQANPPAGTAKAESTQRVNPTVPLSHALGPGTAGHLPHESGTALWDTRGTVGTCLQCGGAIGPGSREITVRSTGTGQLALVHEDCLSRWQHRGPSQ
jgi:hypothetical protein